MSLTPGTHLGPYEILAPLGAGGMGEVYRARDPRLGRDVAVKLVTTEGVPSPDRLRRFETEARAAAQLSHPNVVTVFDVGTHDGQPYLVLELLEGKTLRETLRGVAPSLREAVGWGLDSARGLGAAHERGIVHRDLKPENVFLTDDGRVKVLDFGLAKLHEPLVEESERESPTEVQGTKPGMVLGTVGYMAPEQVRGETPDARTDVFALGALLYELVTRRRPFDGSSEGEVLAAILRDEPPAPSSLHPAVPPALDAVARRCLAKAPAERFSSAREVVAALETVLASLGSGRFASARPPEQRGPYPGLESFRETDTERFFGREAEVEALWARLHERRLLAVIGPSGVGKTSFVRAGVLASRPTGWAAIVCAPGANPFRSLGQALAPQLAEDHEALGQLLGFDEMDTAVELITRWRRAHDEALVVVDQLEELFTLSPQTEQARFAELIGRVATEADVHVVLSMRDDFLMRCSEHDALARVFTELTPLRPLSGDALRRALVEPAKREGYELEEGLVEEMLQSVEGARGALPLLAFAVSRLWEKRDREDQRLTRAAYEEIGGVAGALAQHAEAVLERVGTAKEGIVRDIFRNLVTAQGTRASCEREELLSAFPDRASAETALEELIDARLLTSYEVPVSEKDRETAAPSAERRHRIEIVHESLIKAWPRLVWWQAQDEEGAQLRDQLKQAAHLWDEKGRSEDLLWSGTAEREFEVWQDRYPGQLTAVEDDFARAMIERARRAKRLRRVAGTATLVAALAVAAVTATLWWRGEQARARAEAEALRAESGKLIAIGQPFLGEYPAQALAYGIAALERADTEDARLLALTALAKTPPTRVLQTDGLIGHTTAFSPDGTLFAASGDDPQVRVWSDGGGPPILLPRPEILFRMCQVQFASDRLLVTREGTFERQKAWLWSLPGGELTRTLEVDPGWFLVRGSRVFVLKMVEAEWRTPTGLKSWPLDGGLPTSLGTWDGTGVGFFDIDPTGTMMAESRGAAIYIRPLDALEAPLGPPIGRHSADIKGLGFDPTGCSLAASDVSGELRVWDLTSAPPTPKVLPLPHDGSVDYERGGEWLYLDKGASRLAAGFGEQILVWDLTGPPDALPLVIMGGMTPILALHPSGHWLAWGGTGIQNFGGITFSFVGRESPRVLHGHTADIRGLAFTPDGRALVSASLDGTVRAWPLAPDAGERSRVLWAGGPPLYGAVVDPRGQRVLTNGRDGGEVLVLPLQGAAPRRLEGFSDVANLGFPDWGPAGRHVAAASYQDPQGVRIRVWDVETGEARILNPLGREGSPEHAREDGVTAVAFAADGDLISSGRSGLLRWDVQGGGHEVIHEPVFGTQQGWMTMSVSADRRRALTVAFGDGHPQTVLHDLENGTSQVVDSLGLPHETALDSTGTVGVAGDTEGAVRVAALAGGQSHRLLGHETLVTAVAVSPDDKWIASGDGDGVIRLWRMPDLSKPPVHTLPHAELMARLRSATNLRAVPDEPSPGGYRIEAGPFPGWADDPEW